jgi:hypothetical protein
MKRFLLIAAIVFLSWTQVRAGTLYVSIGEYSTIQSAINAAGNNDTIIVDPNTYYENIDFLGKAITLRSVDPNDPNVVAATIIDGSNPVDPNIGSVVTFANNEDGNSVLTGFTITGGTGSWLLVANWSSAEQKYYNIWNRCGGGVLCSNGSSPTIKKNVFRDNLAGQGGGLYLYDHSDAIVTENTFIDNSVLTNHGFENPDPNDSNIYDHGDGGAIVGYEYCDATITRNFITNNHAESYGGGIHLRQWCNGLIEDNYITGNDSMLGAGIHITYISSPTIRYNLIESNVSGNHGGGGVFVYYLSNPLICNNIIKGNTSGNGAGISVNWTSAPTIINNLIINNKVGGGIQCTSSSPIIKFNTIAGNSAVVEGAGITCRYSASPTIEHNQVVNCKTESGIYVMDTPEYPASPVIRYNNVHNNENGNYSGDISDQTEKGGNVSLPPDFVDPDNEDYHLNYTSRCINMGDPNFDDEPPNDFEGNPRKLGQFVDIGAHEAWPVWNITTGDKYAQIQEGINDANNGDRLIVTQGRYYENLNFNGKSIELLSTDPNDWRIVEETIIDGNNVDTVVLFTSGEDANCVLAGFTITGGLASSSGGYGGGVHIYNYSGPTIRNNRITYNTAWQGAGISLYGSSSMILNNLIFNNFSTPYGFAAGIMINNSDEDLFPISANPIIANNIIVGNNALYAGGICIHSSAPRITNNTIAYNRAEWEGIGVYGEDDTIENCIVWGNINTATWGQGSAIYLTTATYSCIDKPNDVPGEGNISAEPNFINPGYWDDANTPGNLDDDFFVLGNYHLRPGSPCANAGDNNSVPASLEIDIDGEERIFEGIVDIGADELVTNPCDLNDDGIVDYFDIEVMTNEWLISGGQLQSDLFDDDFIDFADFSILAAEWLWKGEWYE